MFSFLNKFKEKNALLLVEVLLTVVIISIVVSSILYSLQRVLSVFKVANDFTKSIYLAESILSQENYDSESVPEEGRFPEPNSDFKWELTREPVSKTGDLYKINVSIKNYNSDRLYAELSTLVKKWSDNNP